MSVDLAILESVGVGVHVPFPVLVARVRARGFSKRAMGRALLRLVQQQRVRRIVDVGGWGVADHQTSFIAFG